MIYIGHRQQELMKRVKELNEEGHAPGSITELAKEFAEKPWHVTSNSEACRRLIDHGYLKLDAEHEDAHPQGQGALLITPEGEEVLASLLT